MSMIMCVYVWMWKKLEIENWKWWIKFDLIGNKWWILKIKSKRKRNFLMLNIYDVVFGVDKCCLFVEGFFGINFFFFNFYFLVVFRLD
jgi:hypothetical protein